MSLRFNNWERLALAVTVAWLIGATVVFFKKEHDRAWSEVQNHLQQCRALSDDARNYPLDTHLRGSAEDCGIFSEAVLANVPTQSEMLKSSALHSVLIAVAAWLVLGAVYVVFLVARWALRGRSGAA